MKNTINVFLQSNIDTGIWIALPAKREDFLTTIQKVNTADADSITISQFKPVVTALPTELLVNANLNLVNYLAARLSELSPDNIELLEAILESPLQTDVFQRIEQIIDFPDNAGVYELYRGVHDSVDLARYYIEKSGLIQMPPEWAEGIDLDRFGKNLEKHEAGFYTRHGYLITTGLGWEPFFEKSGEVPTEYCIEP